MNHNKDNGLLNMIRRTAPHDPANTNFEVPLGAVADVENGMTLLGDPTIIPYYDISEHFQQTLNLTSFPSDNQSNMIMYKARQAIHVSSNYIIPVGVHVIFDAPEVVLDNGFICPIGASFEIRIGC